MYIYITLYYSLSLYIYISYYVYIYISSTMKGFCAILKRMLWLSQANLWNWSELSTKTPPITQLARGPRGTVLFLQALFVKIKASEACTAQQTTRLTPVLQTRLPMLPCASVEKLGFERPESSNETFLKVTSTPAFGVSLWTALPPALRAKRTSRPGFMMEIDELYLTIVKYLLVWECGQQILNDQVWATFTSAKGCIPDMIWSTRYNPKAFKANKYTPKLYIYPNMIKYVFSLPVFTTYQQVSSVYAPKFSKGGLALPPAYAPNLGFEKKSAFHMDSSTHHAAAKLSFHLFSCDVQWLV